MSHWLTIIIKTSMNKRFVLTVFQMITIWHIVLCAYNNGIDNKQSK